MTTIHTQDLADVLSVMDYDFDEAKRHEETLDAYNRVRPLIASAPEMLAALEIVYEMLQELPTGYEHIEAQVRDAIAKAKGGA